MASCSKRILSLCSGIGGLDLGVSLAWQWLTGAEPKVVCYVERQAYCAAALVALMEKATLDNAPIWDDIKTFDGVPWRGKVDILTAGFPCQPFSVAGKNEGVKDSRWLWPDIQRIIQEVYPPIVFLENVPPIIKHGLNEILTDLSKMGYDARWGCFQAAHVGAPHKRERLFLLAYPNSTWKSQSEGSKQNKQRWFNRLYKKVGNSPRPRLSWSKKQQQKAPKQSTPKSTGLGPPPPNSQAWNEVPPFLKPSIRGVVNGVTYRVEQLSALGNGVVPLQAAYAFCALYNIR